jgi:hypothetical protein
MLVAAAALAGEKHETRIEIKTDDSEHGAFEWHSSDPEADFSNLEVGESKTIKGDDGKEVTVTRTEKGLEFDIDGKKIEMADFDDQGDMVIDVDVEHDGDGEVIINKSKNVRIIKTDGSDGVTIISTSELDDETRAKLESVLKDAGKEGDVMFLDGSELHEDAQAHGDHEVRIIKKKVEKTED